MVMDEIRELETQGKLSKFPTKKRDEISIVKRGMVKTVPTKRHKK